MVKKVEKTFPNGDKYEGDYKDGVPHGYGVLIYNEANLQIRMRYEGYFKAGLPQGQGVMTYLPRNYMNLEWIRGGWVEGQARGHGEIVYLDGASYVGEIYDGQPHGQGILCFSKQEVHYCNYARFEGEFEKGEKVKGDLVTPSGSKTPFKHSKDSSCVAF